MPPKDMHLTDDQLAAFKKALDTASNAFQKIVGALTPKGDVTLQRGERVALIEVLQTWGNPKDPLVSQVISGLNESAGPSDGPALHHP